MRKEMKCCALLLLAVACCCFFPACSSDDEPAAVVNVGDLCGLWEPVKSEGGIWVDGTLEKDYGMPDIDVFNDGVPIQYYAGDGTQRTYYCNAVTGGWVWQERRYRVEGDKIFLEDGQVSILGSGVTTVVSLTPSELVAEQTVDRDEEGAAVKGYVRITYRKIAALPEKPAAVWRQE